MQFIDLAAQQERIRERIEANIAAVLDHGKYIMGPEIRSLEEKLAQYVGVKRAISCASGTDALLLALMAYGIGPGDAIFTTPFTFIATGEVISLLGATPVFVDIDPHTLAYRWSPKASLPWIFSASPLIMTALTPLPGSTACLSWKMRPSPLVPGIKVKRPAT
jgi:dTDP-4-amino-4,6-dideoxygalactose transaminase